MKKVNASDAEKLMKSLESRFHKNMHRHPNVTWEEVAKQIGNDAGKLWSLHQMEETGGEPDVVLGVWGLAFIDCAPESPKGRRSCCYDKSSRLERKEHQPATSAIELAEEMGVEVLDEVQYHALQKVETVDQKTSSWLKTPESVRNLGGAIFGDFRYGRVFIYHNGAQSYYAARGFRSILVL